MRVEKWIANFRRAEQRITTSLRTKFRFYESYWLFYCLRLHWFFSLIVFSTDAGRGKAASNWCADSTDISMKKGSKNRYLAGWSNKDTRWKAAVLEEWHKPVERLFLPPARLLGGGHLFLARRDFDLFALASTSSIYKGHEREWVIPLSVCTWVCECACVDGWPISVALTWGWHFCLTSTNADTGARWLLKELMF